MECEELLILPLIPLNGVQSPTLPECEQGGHERVSLFASFSLQDFMDFPKLIFTEIHRRATTRCVTFIAALEIKSNAPTPSTDNTVACGSMSVNP